MELNYQMGCNHMLEYIWDEYVFCNNYFITRHNKAISLECAFFNLFGKKRKIGAVLKVHQ